MCCVLMFRSYVATSPDSQRMWLYVEEIGVYRDQKKKCFINTHTCVDKASEPTRRVTHFEIVTFIFWCYMVQTRTTQEVSRIMV